MTLIASLTQSVPEHWPWYISGLLVIFYIASTVHSWYRLRHIPGPVLAKFSILWTVRGVLSGSVHERYFEASQKYGNLVRIGPNLLLNNDPDSYRKIFAVRSPWRRSTWYKAFRLDGRNENLLSQQNDDFHTVLRAKMAPGYSGKENDGLEKVVDENIAAFINLIDSKYISTMPLFTLDVISHVAYGKPFGNLAADKDVYKYLEAVEQAGPAMMFIANFPQIVDFLQTPIFKFLAPSSKDALGLGKLMGIAAEVVEGAFGVKGKIERDRTMLGSFVRNGLTPAECRSEVLLQIVAGADTTATTIRMALYNIINNPVVHNNLISEISNSSLIPGQIITDIEARKLSYMQATIKESLRIFPPVAGHMSRVAPPEGDTINGFWIPGGTEIGTSVWGMQRDKAFWGDDSGVFRPERWFEAPPSKATDMAGRVDLIFSYGKWQCLGKNVAHMELNKIFVELLRNFHFTQIDPMNPVRSTCNGIFAQSDMWLRVERRDPKL